MTEETYEQKALKYFQRQDEFLKRISEQQLQLQNTTSSEHGPAKKSESAIEHIDVCPTCRKLFIEKLRPEILKEIPPLDVVKEVNKKLKSKDLVTCDGCGEIVGKEEKECPSCHGTHAH